MAYQIKYLKLGGILDQAINIVKDHFGVLFTIMLFLAIPFQLVVNFLELASQQELPPDATPEEVLGAMQNSNNPLVGILNIVYALFVTPITTAAIIHSVGMLYLGKSVTAGGAIKYGINRFLPLIGTNILAYLAIAGGVIVLALPAGFLLAVSPLISIPFFIGAVIVAILLSLWFALTQQIVVIERVAGSKALGRSKKLVRPHLGTLFILGLVVGAITIGLIAASMFIPQPHISKIAFVLATAITTILGTAVITVYYFSCRCAEENFDLHYLAESLGVDEGSGGERDPLAQPTY